jgi:hypothetical protein
MDKKVPNNSSNTLGTASKSAANDGMMPTSSLADLPVYTTLLEHSLIESKAMSIPSYQLR